MSNEQTKKEPQIFDRSHAHAHVHALSIYIIYIVTIDRNVGMFFVYIATSRRSEIV